MIWDMIWDMIVMVAFGVGNFLQAQLWYELSDLMMERYNSLSRCLLACHGGRVPLSPTPDELERLLQNAGA